MAKLKICGLTCKEDIEAVNGAKPDFAGFIIEDSRKKTKPYGRTGQSPG